MSESDISRLLVLAGVGNVHIGAYAVLRAAMEKAVEVAPKCTTAAKTDEAILDTFREAIRQGAVALGEVKA